MPPCIRPAARWFGRLHSDDRGMALASVAILSAVLVSVSGVMAMRVMNQGDGVADDRQWEQALQVAEGGVDLGLEALADDHTFSTGDASAGLTTRTDIINSADLKPADDVITMPNGEVVIVKPVDAELLFAVGYSPGRDEPGRQVRVVEIRYAWLSGTTTLPSWQADMALLSDGDVVIQGNPSKIEGGGDVWANGDLAVGSASQISGCGYAAGSSNHTGCGSGDMPPAVVPIVDPIQAWPLSMYDMCPDGFAHYGPAHPTATALQLPDDGPCSGAVIGNNQGWTGGGGGGAWAPSNNPGVFYVHEADVVGTPGRDHPKPNKAVEAEATIIASKTGLFGTCTGDGGTVDLTAQFNLVGHSSAGGLTVVAENDVILRGGGRIEGLVMAHESVDYAGNATVFGAVIEEDACDEDGVTLTGASRIVWDGPISTPFDYEATGGPTTPTITYIGIAED